VDFGCLGAFGVSFLDEVALLVALAGEEIALVGEEMASSFFFASPLSEPLANLSELSHCIPLFSIQINANKNLQKLVSLV
jgi:hypothetical protein